MKRFAVGLGMVLSAGMAMGQSCVSQSQMKVEEKDALKLAAYTLALGVQANDDAGVKAQTVAEYAKDFAGVAGVMSDASPKLKGGKAAVEQVYVLDASQMKATGDAQFYCTLNGSTAEADFTIPQLPVGRYGFAMVRFDGAEPWRVSFLLRQEAGKWLLAGIYPKPLSAGGHEGLWYWQQAREFSAKKQPWVAWLYDQEAEVLLQPAPFVSSTHLEKLAGELASAAPPEVKGGVSDAAKLVVKGADGVEYRFTSLGTDNSLGKEKIDVAAHLKVDALGDAAAARKRNLDAMAALVTAHPELKGAFHGVWIFADAPGQTAYATEAAMAEIK
ncbi:hypothetical protein [Granulicella tundricola]|uniref:DUF4440 domain-containing protein n=1 Tax=Granulicella tundricola (strain ATCC BAA-1859 / DSM 23138 / MP5ACTX9) TaxID=1198114 RepID=E8X5F7_GRATM|nr:hypothetical protein [Granulicella tundricola]ADW69504.1 hypothetical protein AciX9_2471 [Granulicella tundricola MP5ACTX9]